MKRIWFGAAMLVFLLVFGFFISAFMERTHAAQIKDLTRAAELAQEGNWTGAENFMGAARREWDRKRPFVAALSDHEPMDEAEMLFAQLEAFAKAKEAALYSSTCLQLARQMEALGQSHRLNLQNLL